MTAESRGRWVSEHPVIGSALFCAVLVLPGGLLILARSQGNAALTLATAIGAWAAGTAAMAIAVKRDRG